MIELGLWAFRVAFNVSAFFLFMSVCLSVFLYVFLSVFLSVFCLYFCLSFCLSCFSFSVCFLSVLLFVFLSVFRNDYWDIFSMPRHFHLKLTNKFTFHPSPPNPHLLLPLPIRIFPFLMTNIYIHIYNIYLSSPHSSSHPLSPQLNLH